MIKLNIIKKWDEPMSFFWLVLLAVIVVILIYVAVHRLLINRATLMLKNQAQSVTDQAVNDCLTQLTGHSFSLSSEIVADVWGKGVLAFEFHFTPAQYYLPHDQFSRDDLEKKLTEYAKQNQIQSFEKSSTVFKVTDWWTYENVLHIDVAYVLNEATREYIADLRRLDQHDQKSRK